MTLPLTNSYATADTYTDVNGLAGLRRGAAAKDPQAIRQVAQQFEAMFTGMMLKSMRATVGQDPLTGSDQEQMFQEMYDQQLSLQMSKGKGLGLADMLIRQLQRMGTTGGDVAGGTAAAVRQTAGTTGSGAVAPAGGGGAGSVPPAVQQKFISDLLPQAQAAGRQLGIDPCCLIAQAALESNWGQNEPAGSHNLFGVKAGGNWQGPSAMATTTEYQAGTAVTQPAAFRTYSSTQQSFQDYVALLGTNPRYAAALNTGTDAQAFAAGLQRGGYATDPDYARKVGAVAAQVAGQLSALQRNGG